MPLSGGDSSFNCFLLDGDAIAMSGLGMHMFMKHDVLGHDDVDHPN